MCCTKKYYEPNIYVTNRCVAPKIRRTNWCMYVMNRSNAPKNEMNQLCILYIYVYYMNRCFATTKIWWINILWTDVLHLKLQSCTFFSKFANFATFAQSAQVCLFCTISSTFAQVFKFAQSAQLSIFALFSCPEQLNRTHCPSGTTKGTFTFDITDWPKRPVTFETFDQSDEETWPDNFLTMLNFFLNFFGLF